MPKINLTTIGMLIKKRWYYYGFFSLVGLIKSGFEVAMGCTPYTKITL